MTVMHHPPLRSVDSRPAPGIIHAFTPGNQLESVYIMVTPTEVVGDLQALRGKLKLLKDSL